MKRKRSVHAVKFEREREREWNDAWTVSKYVRMLMYI